MTEDDYLKRPPRFNAERNEDFQLWALRFEVLAEAKDVSSVLFQDAVGDQDIDALDPSERVKIIKARALLVMCLGSKALRTVAGEKKNPFRMYKRLEERYATKTAASRVQLQTQLHQMKYDSEKSMSEYIDGLESIFNQLESMESPVGPSMQVAILLASFGTVDESPYGPVVSALQTMSDETLTWEAATARLLQEYTTRNRASSSKSDSRNGAASEPRALKSMAKVRCFGCKQFGHYKRNCPNKKPKREWKTDYSRTDDYRRMALTANVKEATSTRLIIDSGASSHMVNSSNLLLNARKSAPMTISVGDGRKLMSDKLGTVSVSVTGVHSQRKTILLKNVLLVPGLDSNLLSCSELVKDGYSTVFSDDGCQILRNGKPIAKAELQNGLYTMFASVNNVQKTANLVKRANGGQELWHQRLGHVHIRCIDDMILHNSVSGMNSDESPRTGKDCEHCIKGKMARLSLKSRVAKARVPGEVIYTDVCGPMSVPSIGGAKYFVTFNDEWSGHKQVRILHKKSDVQNAFIKYHRWFERQFNCSVKALYSDHGGEFEALHGYLEDTGIQDDYSAPYTPQQNGVAERLNRTLMDMARSMMDQAGLPASFWAEAVTTAVKLRNVTGTKATGFKTPIETLTGNKPDVRGLRIFGCEAWMHVPKRKKLAMKARRGIVLRSLPRGNYRLWDIDGRRTVETRHVLINETVFPAREWRSQDVNRKALDEWYSSLFKTTEGELNQEKHDDDDAQDGLNSIFGEENIPLDGRDNSEDEDEESISQGNETSLVQDALTYTPAVPSRHGESPRYPTRVRKSVDRFGKSANAAIKIDQALPNSVSEALRSYDADHWKAAIDSEVNSLFENKTWTTVKLPEGQRALDSKMVFSKKYKEDGSIDRYKARLVVKGFQQRDVVDVYAPVVDFTTVRVAVAVAIAKGYTVHQLDVKTAFLNGHLEDDECIYVSPPRGLDMCLPPNTVLKLNKALYGLKRAPKIWNDTFDKCIKGMGFLRFDSDDCVYISVQNSHIVYVLIYVDDILIMSGSVEKVQMVKKRLMKQFKIQDLGKVRRFLGVDFKIWSNGIFITQEAYTKSILERFGMGNCNPVRTPLEKNPLRNDDSDPSKSKTSEYKEVIGCLLYLSTRTRPDISAAVGILSRDASCPANSSWKGIKRVLRYLSGTADYGLLMARNSGSLMNLVAYADADWAGDVKTRKSTSGNVIFLNDSPISWLSKKQGSVALSSSEAEYISLSECAKEVKWLRDLLQEFGVLDGEDAGLIMEDNSGAMKWAMSEKRAKHVDIRYHYVKYLVEKEVIKISYCPTSEMIADVLTKPISADRFEKLRDALCVIKPREHEPMRQGGEC